MTCSICKQYSPTNDNAFVKGTTYLQIDGIKAHKNSECHTRSSSRETAENKPVLQSKAGKALVALKRADHDKLIIKMRNAHACGKHSLSFKTYEVMCRLDKLKELPVGSQYCTDKAGAVFCESIAKTTRIDIIKKVKNCSWCSISCNGSTDFTGEDMEAVYVRTCTHGKIEDSVLHLGTSESGCSRDIFDILMSTFQNMRLDGHMKSKLVGFCADGASNMQGMRRVAALLKQRWPHLITTHCLVHRLELAFKDAVKNSSPKLYEKTITLLLGLYYMFRKSPKQKKGLQRAFDALGVKQLLPTRIGGTCWLPHIIKVINIFLKTYKVLENSSQDNPKAEGLARILCDGHVLVYIISMKRIIQNLSLYLQRDNLSLADAYTRVESAKTTLTQLLDKFNIW
ncbi:ZN862-like protein [Mya arenaria]|uniref:ZN862-like protein n=1 Tax=Mya arenaria TaxID=6604 RepID=A0ABY7FGR2_MYAAR|nr:ZN862-like protein [Mya arenaria]